MTEAERIEFLITNLEGGNGSRFGEKIGAQRAAVSDMRKGKRGLRLWVDKIIQAYPAIRKEWLTTGEGYPGDLSVDLVRQHYEGKIRRNEMIIDQLISQIEELKKQTDLQNACK